jgi:hypothetical protein
MRTLVELARFRGGSPVFVLTILGIVVGAVLLLAALLRFEQHAVRRYGHQFFTRGAFAAAAIAVGCIVGGRHWWLASRADGGPLNGLLLIVAGAIVAVAMIARNLRRTGIVMGACGSLLQVAVFGAIGYFGLIALAIGFLCVLLVAGGTKPVWVVNRW